MKLSNQGSRVNQKIENRTQTKNSNIGELLCMRSMLGMIYTNCFAGMKRLL